MTANETTQHAAERLQDAVGRIDDAYVAEADGPASAETAGGATAAPARRRRRWAVPAAIAACAVLAAGIGLFAAAGRQAADLAAVPEAAVESAFVTTDGLAGAEEADAVRGEALDAMAVEEAVVAAAEAAAAPSAGDPSGTGSPGPRDPGEAFVLTAAEWNDNLNWPFFTNLVNSGAIAFPSFGLDPTRRVAVHVADASGAPVRGAAVTLRDDMGAELWRATSGKDGAAYLFYREGQYPATVESQGAQANLAQVESVGDGASSQGLSVQQLDEVDLVVDTGAPAPAGLQVMFIIDTTGSMVDELAYLQKDFGAIAGEVGADGVEWSANFYRDEGDDYVVRTNSFTANVPDVQAQLAAEYADGGGDEPEAVADALAACITDNGEWRDEAAKLAFLVFDAPPHEGTEAALDAAVRSAAERGVALVPVVASNAERATELFGRALAIMTNGTYVFLTDDSGVGDSHLEPIVGDYTVELLHDVIVRIIEAAR